MAIARQPPLYRNSRVVARIMVAQPHDSRVVARIMVAQPRDFREVVRIGGGGGDSGRMALSARSRRRWNRVNGTTYAGLALAAATRTPRQSGPLGTVIAANYPLRVPGALCFVVGDVVFCRRDAAWLLSSPARPILVHELRHTYQYARWGPLFWPLYFASSGWSYLVTGNFGVRNAFERGAGLADGGYADAPVRPALSRLGSLFRT
jgi:hypothetical protein